MDIEISPILVADKKDPVDVDLTNAIVEVGDNKLILSKDAVKALDAKAKDRIAVNYWTIDCETTFPLIGRSESFTDPTDGNKLTKSNTVSFRGEQRQILLRYGSNFKLERFKDYFKLVPISGERDCSLSEEEDALEKLN